MSIIYTVISHTEATRLGERDHDFFKRKLQEHCLLNDILHKPIYSKLLAELLCILDRKPLPRRKIEHRNGKITVRKVSPEEMEKLWVK